MNKIIKIILSIFLFSCVDNNSTQEDLIINSIKQVSPAVVSISIKSTDNKEKSGFGSGIIIEPSKPNQFNHSPCHPHLYLTANRKFSDCLITDFIS